MNKDFDILELLYLEDLDDLYEWRGFTWCLCLKKVMDHHLKTPFPKRMKKHPDFFEYYHIIECYEKNK